MTPADEGIAAARLDARIAATADELINAGLAPYPRDEHNAAEYLRALATAVNAYRENRREGRSHSESAATADFIARHLNSVSGARNYARSYLPEAIAHYENERAEEEQIAQTEEIIEATAAAYENARDTGADVATAIVAAMKAAIAAGATVDEAAQTAQIAHEHDVQSEQLARQEHAATAAERIAADAIQAAYIGMREEQLESAERLLTKYARAIAWQQGSMSERDASELDRLAQQVHDAREALAGTRANYGLTDPNEARIEETARKAIAYYREERGRGIDPEQAAADARQYIHDQL